MTQTPTQPDEASASASTRRRKRAVVALLLLALAAGWWLAAGSAARGVSVAWAGPPACDGAKFAPVRGMGPPPAIHARRGFRCTIMVVVHNDGFLPVHLDRLVAPYVGRGRRGGAIVVADSVPPFTAEQRRTGETDAHYVIDRELRADETHQVRITLGFREQGCSAARTTLHEFPRLRLDALGRSGLEVPGARDLVFIQAGPSAACPAP